MIFMVYCQNMFDPAQRGINIKELSIVWNIRKDALIPIAVYIDLSFIKDSLDIGQGPITHALGYSRFWELFGPPKNAVEFMYIEKYLAVLKLFFVTNEDSVTSRILKC